MSIRKLKKYEPLLHLAFWCLIFFFPYVKYFAKADGYQMTVGHELNALLFYLIPTYTMYLWFFPLKNKRKYLLIVVVIFLVNSAAFDYFDGFFHSVIHHWKFGWKQFTSSIATNVTFSIVFFAFYSVKNLYIKQERLDKLTIEKQIAEYEGLKSQINPHFLFNTLNAIYANALKTDENNADLILKLANNFRYLFHEGRKDRVKLSSEINHLKDYIDLQKERLKSKVRVQFKDQIADYDQLIAPLLLIPFVENAFKYSSTVKGKGHPIEILIIHEMNKFSFYCSNIYANESDISIEDNWKNSGIGINNTKQRLKYLYPENHSLVVSESENVFTVSLKINL